MLKSRRSEVVVAYLLMAPFVVVYGVLFVYPTIKMAQLSFTDAPLIGPGQWVGFRNFVRLSTDRLFSTAIWNTAYFVLLSVIPGTLLGLVVAVGVNRLKGWLQSLALAAFFLPYILPVSVVFRIWNWMFDKDYGIAQNVVALFNGGQHLSIFRTIPLFMPAVALSRYGGCSASMSCCSSLGFATFPARSTRRRRWTAPADGHSFVASPGR